MTVKALETMSLISWLDFRLLLSYMAGYPATLGATFDLLRLLMMLKCIEK